MNEQILKEILQEEKKQTRYAKNTSEVASFYFILALLVVCVWIFVSCNPIG